MARDGTFTFVAKQIGEIKTVGRPKPFRDLSRLARNVMKRGVSGGAAP